jgi:RNA polymerase sigma factor (TIGR02999 family)
MADQRDVTQLLKAWGSGNQQALDDLLPAVYAEVRRLARSYLRRERADHTLQATALVNEAYLRLVDQRKVEWQSRAHFFGIAAQIMRRILTESARRRKAAKRGAGIEPISLEMAPLLSEAGGVDFADLDEALQRLTVLDPRQGQLVELRFFGGLSIEETAEVMKLSPATIKREWSSARAWLRRELSGAGLPGDTL